MDNALRREIQNRMELKETDELLEIWQKNDHAEWTDEAFEVIRDVLKKRGVDAAKQGQPVYEHTKVETDDRYDFTDEELKIIDDKNPPTFYDPFDVLLTTRQIDKMSKVMIGFLVVYNIINYPRTWGIVQSYFLRSSDSVLIDLVAILLAAANTGIAIVIAYLPLRALSRVLRILMEMEFNSRKANF